MSNTESSPAARTGDSPTDATFMVQFSHFGQIVPCGGDEFVMDAAARAGLKLPSSCRKGICGTCKSKLVQGQVDMRHGGGIRPRDIANGFFLPCCSIPLSDLIVET